jgi:hypothetical protein
MSSSLLATSVSLTDFHQIYSLCKVLIERGKYVETVLLIIIYYQRLSSYFSLPAHYQRRVLLDALGVLNLPHLPHTPPSPSPEFPLHVHPIPDLPDDSELHLAMRDRPDEFYRLVRMTLTEFLVIYYELEQSIRAPRNALAFGISVDDLHINHMSHRTLHPADELLLFLLASDGASPPVLARMFEVDRTSAGNIIDHVTSAINSVYDAEVSWPSQEEREASYGLFSCYHKAVGCLDGTHVRIDVPSNQKQDDELYSGYKKYHTQNFLLICNAFGFIIFIAGPFPGSCNDRSCFISSVLMQPSSPLLAEGERLLTDGGFAGDGPLLYPYNKVDLDSADSVADKADMISWNEEIVLNRSIVEHCNHLVKDRARALQQKWGNTKERQAALFCASARLINRIRRVRMEYSMYNITHVYTT